MAASLTTNQVSWATWSKNSIISAPSTPKAQPSEGKGEEWKKGPSLRPSISPSYWGKYFFSN